MDAQHTTLHSLDLLHRLAGELELDASALIAASEGVAEVALPSPLAVGELAWASVLAAGAAFSGGAVRGPDPARIAAAYRSDRHLIIDGAAPDVWSPLSRFWQVSNGWVRTHGNYPHHARALRQGLGLSDEATPEAIGVALRRLTSEIAAARVGSAGGLCVPARREQRSEDARLRQHPLINVSRVGDAPRRRLRGSGDAPLNGVRVLDMTRVIAGPVTTRTLAFAGADVLRIDPPHRAELAWQHLDTGHGKRSALLNIAENPAHLDRLLVDADVVVLGYRLSGLARLGLSPAALVHRHPHLVIAQLSAWPGDDSPRGFDSLVQADSGISWIQSADGSSPGALPAQALDHSAGYLLAAGVATALHRRAARGGTWRVRTSLRRVAAELLSMRRAERPDALDNPPVDPAMQTFDVGGHRVTTVAPAVAWPDSPEQFAPPREWGGDSPEW